MRVIIFTDQVQIDSLKFIRVRVRVSVFISFFFRYAASIYNDVKKHFGSIFQTLCSRDTKLKYAQQKLIVI